jgi:hypothetical protein
MEKEVTKEKENENEIFKKFSEEYPDLYKALVATQQVELIMKKTLDYGVDNISMGSDLRNIEDRDLAMKGAWFRMQDKMQRLKNLVVVGKKSEVKDESVEDTYMDLINYGIISRLVKKGLWKK